MGLMKRGLVCVDDDVVEKMGKKGSSGIHETRDRRGKAARVFTRESEVSTLHQFFKKRLKKSGFLEM